MSLDETLFHRVHRWWTGRRRRAAEASQFDLTAAEPRWRRLLALLRGESIGLTLGDGHSRIDDHVSLPTTLPLGPEPGDAQAIVTLRLALSAAAMALAPCDPRFAPFDQAPAKDAADAAMQEALPRLLAWLDNEWPSVRSLLPIAERYQAHLTVQFGHSAAAEQRARRTTYGQLPLRARKRDATNQATEATDTEALPSGTERQRKRRGDVEVIEIDERDDGQNPLAHVLEKVRTAEEHTAGNRSMDGSDEMDAQLEAIEDLDLSRVVRTRTRTASVFRADVEFESITGDLIDEGPPPTQTFSYDEWDERKRSYLPSWCAVGEATAPSSAADTCMERVAAVRAHHGSTIRQVRAEFARLLRGNAWLRRQAIGSDIDIDAVVDRHGDLRAAESPGAVLGEPRLYVARRPSAQEVAVTILFDRSLSSDSWVSGRRVLDVTRQAVTLLAEALHGIRLPVSVAAFCSHTRKDCRFDLIKGFTDPWHAMAPRLYGLEPDGYTRIGPAVRHAAFRLAEQPARRRLLLVLSDCKPVDYDHYEGRRGIGDVRQSVREARRCGIETLALAIDAKAGEHLAQMFGTRGFRVVPDERSLAQAMARLHERLLRR